VVGHHSPAVVWNYTPREISGHMDFARRVLKLEKADQLTLSAIAARGDSSDIESRHKDLLRGV
jgi:hypothetical protein